MGNTNAPARPGPNGNLKVFVASPGDVEPERQQAFSILETLQLVYDFAIYRWEDTIPGYGPPVQQQISSQIPIGECHVFVALLGHRLGTPTGMQRADGTPYLSGTQYEIEQAIEAYARNQNGLPKIMIYRKMDDPSPAISRDSEAFIQYGRLLEFLKLFEPGGKYPAWIYPFRGGEFEGRFRTHIAKVLAELQNAAAPRQAEARSRSTAAAILSPAADVPSVLTSDQIQAGKAALLAAFSREELRQVVYYAWNIDYETVVARGALGDEVFQLLTWANRQRQVAALIRRARRANPTNPTLASFATEIGLE